VTKKVEKMVKLGGTSDVSAEGTTHSFSEDETVAFADWINYSLGDDPDLKYLLPIDTTDMGALFEAVKVTCPLPLPPGLNSSDATHT